MTNERLRRAIVVEAARLMYSRNQTEYYRAKLKAAKRLCKGWIKPAELPTNAEIRDEIQRMANLFEGSSRFDRLRPCRDPRTGLGTFQTRNSTNESSVS